MMISFLIRYFGIFILRSLKSPRSACGWHAAQLAGLFTSGFFHTAGLISRASCLRLNQAVSVIFNGAVGALQRLEALFTRKAVISLLSWASSDASVPKCLSKPAMTLRQDSAGSSPGA